MKKFLTVIMAGLLVVAFVVPALAWEFNVKGEYEYRLRYIGRAGTADLFGIAPLQDGALAIANNIAAPAPFEGNAVGFAGPNFYNRNRGNTTGFAAAFTGATVTEATAAGTPYMTVNRPIDPTTAGYSDVAGGRARIVRGGFSTWDSDALYSDSRLTLEPEFRVNPAIRVHGVYTIGGYRHKYFQNYIGGYGLGIGTPPLERYYSSQVSMNAYDTAAIGSWEQFRATMQVPYGIFSIGVKDFPFGTGATLAYNTRAEAWLTVLPYGPFRWLHGIWLSRGWPGHESWITVPDGGTKPSLFQGLLMTYDVATLNLGAGAVWRMAHLNRQQTQDAGLAANGADHNTLFWLAFLKYNNGRFFAAAEYASIQVEVYRLGAFPVFVEAYHWNAELGAVAGPAKLRLLYNIASGLVRNNGNRTKSYRPFPINYQAMKPYQFLMFETFAGGNNGGWNATDVSFVSDDHGMMSDAYCYAARLDYAVASNLNMWGSYIWAHRLERAGAFKGGILSTGADATAAQRQAWVLANFGAASGEAGGPINPYVDDGYLGWELGIGVDWKLLENLNMGVQWNYWQPGEWFDQAYQAVGMLGGVPSNAALVVGRSPIQAIQGSFLINF